MSDETATADAPTTATPKVRVPDRKPAAKKPAPAAKSAPKKPAAPAKTASGEKTIRERVFEVLAKSKEGMTGAQIKEKLGLGGIPDLLKDEGVCEKPRIRRVVQEGVRGVVYQLTALGRKHVEQGKVNDEAAPRSAGKEW